MKRLSLEVMIVVLLVFAGYLIANVYSHLGGRLGAQVSNNVVEHQITSVASSSIVTISTVPVRLVDNPGSNCVIEPVSVTAHRIFSGTAFDFAGNKTVDEGFEVRLDETGVGADVISSFSKGFVDGGAAASIASPSYQVRKALDVNASVSESLWLTASTSFAAYTGDTYFIFDTAYRKICQ